MRCEHKKAELRGRRRAVYINLISGQGEGGRGVDVDVSDNNHRPICGHGHGHGVIIHDGRTDTILPILFLRSFSIYTRRSHHLDFTPTDKFKLDIVYVFPVSVCRRVCTPGGPKDRPASNIECALIRAEIKSRGRFPSTLRGNIISVQLLSFSKMKKVSRMICTVYCRLTSQMIDSSEEN